MEFGDGGGGGRIVRQVGARSRTMIQRLSFLFLLPSSPFLPLSFKEQREEMMGENDDKAFNVSVRGLWEETIRPVGIKRIK